jgi:hypothetical protein
MKAVEYLKEKARMTNGCGSQCNPVRCPLSSDNTAINGIGLSCTLFEKRYPEKAVEIVEKWAKENPPKTYLSVLLEKLPKAVLDEDGTPAICPHNLFGGKKWDKCKGSTFGGCEICWNREYKEETNE